MMLAAMVLPYPKITDTQGVSKALACNVKRMVRARLDEMLVPPAALATAPPTA